MNAKDIKTQLIRPRPTYISVLILNIHAAYIYSRHFPPWNNSILQKSKKACVTAIFISMCWFFKHIFCAAIESRLYLILHKVALIGSLVGYRIFVDIKNATFHSYIIIQTRLLLTRLGELNNNNNTFNLEAPFKTPKVTLQSI